MMRCLGTGMPYIVYSVCVWGDGDVLCDILYEGMGVLYDILYGGMGCSILDTRWGQCCAI